MGDRICEDCGLPVVICIAKDMVNEAAKQHGRAAVLSALDAAEARDVGVRELVWDNCPDSRYRGGFNHSEWISRGSALSYTIQRLTGAKMRRVGLEGKFRLNVRGFHMFGPDHDTLELAQAAAQADYTARILSALHPASPLGAVAMKAAARRQALGYAASDYSEECTIMANAIVDDIEALPLPTDAELLAAAAEMILQHVLGEQKEDKEDPLIAGAVIPWLQDLAALAPFTRKGE